MYCSVLLLLPPFSPLLQLEALKATHEEKMEEKRKKRLRIKKKLVKKEGLLDNLQQKVEEMNAELEAIATKSKSETQLAALVREALESKLQALTDSKEKETAALMDEILTLKRQCVPLSVLPLVRLPGVVVKS